MTEAEARTALTERLAELDRLEEMNEDGRAVRHSRWAKSIRPGVSTDL
ncbi:MAG: hypothetical protein WBA68_01470 [Alteraurantiacibacter sp.]